MSTQELLFGAFTNLFVLGWGALVLACFLPASVLRRRLLFTGGRLAPLLLLAAFLVGYGLTRGLPGNIFTLDGVLMLFGVPEKVLTAWFETLGIALLVCRWMVDDAERQGAPLPLLATSLVAAFFAVALGLFIYLGWLQITGGRRQRMA